jgi:hypothetical protein
MVPIVPPSSKHQGPIDLEQYNSVAYPCYEANFTVVSALYYTLDYPDFYPNSAMPGGYMHDEEVISIYDFGANLAKTQFAPQMLGPQPMKYGDWSDLPYGGNDSLNWGNAIYSSAHEPYLEPLYAEVYETTTYDFTLQSNYPVWEMTLGDSRLGTVQRVVVEINNRFVLDITSIGGEGSLLGLINYDGMAALCKEMGTH